MRTFLCADLLAWSVDVAPDEGLYVVAHTTGPVYAGMTTRHVSLRLEGHIAERSPLGLLLAECDLAEYLVTLWTPADVSRVYLDGRELSLADAEQVLIARLRPRLNATAPIGEDEIAALAVRAPLAEMQQISEAAQRYFAAAQADNTRRAYRADFRHFAAWCAARNCESLPARPSTVGAYLVALAESGYAVATIDRRVCGIKDAHRSMKHPSPIDTTVHTLMAGIRRVKGTAQKQAAPALTDALRAMVRATPATLTGFRDRALLLVGFAGALRRSELVGLDVADLEWPEAGLVLIVRRSKTDQEAAGRRIAIPRGMWAETCPVRALRAWLSEGSITAGPAFRPIDRHGHIAAGRLSGNAVSTIVKRTAAAAGLDGDFSGHSLRAGLATSAAAAGVSDRQIARQTGHQSMRVLARYIREGELFRDNVAGQVGL